MVQQQLVKLWKQPNYLAHLLMCFTPFSPSKGLQTCLFGMWATAFPKKLDLLAPDYCLFIPIFLAKLFFVSCKGTFYKKTTLIY